MAETTISLPQLFNLAFKPNQDAKVNYAILQTALSILLQQTNLTGVNVTFHGNDSENIASLLAENAPGDVSMDYSAKISSNATIDPIEEEILEEILQVEGDLRGLGGESDEKHHLPKYSSIIAMVSTLQNRVLNLEQKTHADEVQEKTDVNEEVEEKEEEITKEYEIVNIKRELSDIKRNIHSLKYPRESIESILKEDLDPDIDHRKIQKIENLENTEKCLEMSVSQINRLYLLFNSQILDLQHHIQLLEDDVETLRERAQETIKNVDMCDLERVSAKLTGNIQDLKREIQEVTPMIERISQCLLEKENQINTLVDFTANLHAIKVDKDFFHDAIMKKANASDLLSYITQTQFLSVYSGVTGQINNIISDFDTHQARLDEHHEHVRVELAKKLEADAIEQAHEVIDGKLNEIRDRVLFLESIQVDRFASGTKSKTLYDANCVSCNIPTLMRRVLDHPVVPNLKPLDTGRSQRTEKIVKRKKVLKSEFKMVNRYVGGSHTKIKRSENVTKVSNFVDEWNLEDCATNGFGPGSDGKMYKVNTNGGDGMNEKFHGSIASDTIKLSNKLKTF